MRTCSGNCGDQPCIRFDDRGSYGAMGDHIQGVYYMGDGFEYEGSVSMRVRFHNG